MSLPPFAPIPPANVRLSLAPEEWSACLHAWLALAELTIRSNSKDLPEVKTGQKNVNDFLRSFYHESAHLPPDDETLRNPKAQRLRKACFSLANGAFMERRDGQTLLEWKFLTDFCQTHVRSSALGSLLGKLWKEHPSRLEAISQTQKVDLISKLESKQTKDVVSELQRLAPVLRASPDMATLFMTGSDFLDGLVLSYNRNKATEDRKAITLVLYLCLEALVKVEPQNVSLLSDHMYSLKASADKTGSKDSALADLVTNTPLVARLRRSVSGKGSDRLFKLLDSLDTYRSTSIARPRKRVRRKLDKGKGKVMQMDGDLHMHRMSLVTQVQDLFPDLGSGFIMKLLDEYDDDVEQVTAHLLDDSLPQHLKDLDRTAEAPMYATNHAAEVDQLAPRSTPPPPESYMPERRNVFDDDELDHLEMDTYRLHIGKRNDESNSKQQPNKAAILSALAAFDSDDDERDDTYDVDDVGGTVDTAHPDGEPAPAARAVQEENDAALFKVYKSSPELFGRTFDVRRGQARQALKAETGMTDEAIEGWAIMLQRNPKQLARLESKFSAAGAFDGRQTDLGRTAYRETPGGTETEDSDAAPNAPRGGFRGRWRGRGRGGGRGGNVAGPSNEAGTAAAQRRKEENKGSRANHNRRDQRARKMARGGFAG